MEREPTKKPRPDAIIWTRLLERGTRFELATTCLEGRGSAGLSYPRVAPPRVRSAQWKYAGWAAHGSIVARRRERRSHARRPSRRGSSAQRVRAQQGGVRASLRRARG